MRTRLLLGFAFLGGAVAWFLHLFVVAGLGEGLCVLGVPRGTFLRMSWIGWILLVVTAAFLGVALLAAYAAVVARARSKAADATAGSRAALFLANTGLGTNLAAAVVIVVQAMPVLMLLDTETC